MKIHVLETQTHLEKHGSILQTITEAGSSRALWWPTPIYQLGHLAAFS